MWITNGLFWTLYTESHNIVVYVNSTPFCTSIDLEHHRGPCRSVTQDSQTIPFK
jgi:hypothetical protein